MRHIVQLQNLIQKDNSHVIIVIYDRLDKIEAKELQEKLEKLGSR